MATSYTSNKKIGALDSASTPLGLNDEFVVNQAGDTLKTPLSAVEAKVFSSDGKSTQTTPSGTEIVIVRQPADNVLRQVALSNIVPAANITNDKVAPISSPSYLGITDDKLATINTAGKVTNTAVQASTGFTAGNYDNAVGANRIVTRDGSGNFAAGTITATLSGNASTATIASSVADGSVTSAKIADSAVTSAKIADSAVTSAKIADETIVNSDISLTAGIVDTKLATISTAGKISNSATTATSANTASAIVARDASGNFSAGTITANLTGNASGSSGSCTGNAATATALQSSQNFQLAGDVTSSAVSFNGSSSVTLTGTLADNAVTTSKISNLNVTTGKIADSAVTPAKLSQPYTLMTARAWNWNGLTTNTSIDFEGIPSWAKRITVIFHQLSFNQTVDCLVQIGSGSMVTSGYYSLSSMISGNPASFGAERIGTLISSGAYSGFIVRGGSGSLALHGTMTISLVTGTTWVANHVASLPISGGSNNAMVYGAGHAPALSAPLDRVRITAVGGVGTGDVSGTLRDSLTSARFDFGTVNIAYEG